MAPGKERDKWDLGTSTIQRTGWSRSQQRTEVTQSAFSDHSAIKQEINTRRIIGGSSSVWKLSNFQTSE